MPIIDDPDFLTSRAKQLAAVQELARLRARQVELRSELRNRMHERRHLIERLTEQDLARQRARASETVRAFDQNAAALRDTSRRLEIDSERERLSIEWLPCKNARICARLWSICSLEITNRMHERPQIIERPTEQALMRRREDRRVARSAAVQRARASDIVRTFDQNVAALRDKIRRLEIDIERERLSIAVAIANVVDRSIGLMSQRGAA